MKLTNIGILTILSVTLMLSNANANMMFDIYTGGTFGVGGQSMFIDDKHESVSSMSYGAVLGIDIPMFRFDAEYNYLDAKDTTLNIGMLNAYFKIPSVIVKPYIGAGVGMAFSGKYEPENTTRIDMDSTAAYQAMLGITLDIPAIPFDIDVEGRALYIPDIFETDDATPDILQYDGRIKLRYIF